jgi:predicted peptidase
MKLFCITLLIIVTLSSHAQNPGQKHKTYSQKYFQGMRYGFFAPVNYKKSKSYPLIVYLHGSRDTVSRDSNYYSEAFQSQHPAFMITPKCTDPNLGWGDTWHDQHTSHAAKVVKLIDSLASHLSIDKKRIYIYGISMGGFGVFSMLAKEPGKFAAAYAICGGSDTKAAPKLLNTPLWIFHGTDDDIVPVHLSRDIYKEILKLGGKVVKYTEYPGVKHNSWENALKEKGLNDWLFSYPK